ncbi:MAG TPA: hypothetical protein VFE65_06190 [Pseudonocardia sp.]|nr:hypothetical protein [Pseudonocardia sp.]
MADHPRLPALRQTALSDGQHFATATLSGQTFALAVLAGAAITPLTRMRTGTRDDVARVIASVAIGFLIAGLGMVPLDPDLAGIQAGGHYTYSDRLLRFGWTVAGNTVGGIALTTLLRLVRGKERLKEWRTTLPQSVTGQPPTHTQPTDGSPPRWRPPTGPESLRVCHVTSRWTHRQSVRDRTSAVGDVRAARLAEPAHRNPETIVSSEVSPASWPPRPPRCNREPRS